MKKLTVSRSLIVGLIVGTAACQSPQEKASTAPVNHDSAFTSDSASLGLRVAYVNMDSLAEGYEYFKGLRAQLEMQYKSLESELQRKGQVLQENVQILEQQASRLSEAELQQAQQELLYKQQQAVEYRDAQGRKLAEEEKKLTDMFHDDMKGVLDSLRQAKNLDYILSYTEMGGILSANPALDITTEVVNSLNAVHRNRNQKKDEKK